MDRSTRGGGVAIFVKSFFHARTFIKSFVIEFISVEVMSNLLLTCVYISPHQVDRSLDALLEHFYNLSQDHDHIIIGDFNMPDIDWNLSAAISTKSDLFCDAIFDCNLFQLIDVPTHVHGNILDLVLTNVPERVSSMAISKSSPLNSDHFSISFLLSVNNHLFSRLPSSEFYVYNFSKADDVGICDYLLNVDFSNCYDSNDTEFIWSEIKMFLLLSIEAFVPKVKRHRFSGPIWFTPEIYHSINKIRTLRRRISRSCGFNQQALFVKLADMESNLNLLMNHARSDYEQSLASSFQSDRGRVFRYLKSLSSPRFIPEFIQHNESDPVKQCDLFNSYFNSVYTRSSFSFSTVLQGSSQFPTFSEAEVYNVLSSLDPTKAHGIDGIGPAILKAGAVPLSAPLAYLFNICVSSSSFPKQWKHHLITPVFKSGDKTTVSNYRPISLLCSTSKVLERLIFNKIIDFIYPRISPHQYGKSFYFIKIIIFCFFNC